MRDDDPGRWRTVPVRALLHLDQPGVWGADRGEQLVRVLRSTNLTKDGRLRIDSVALRALAQRDRERRRLLPGDVVLERSGGSVDQPVGRVVRVPPIDDLYCSNFCQQLRADPAVCHPGFLYRVLWRMYETGVTQRMQHATTGIRNLDYDAYLRHGVLLPPLAEQRAIAGILDSIDNAIEKTEAVIEATGQLRRALLQEMLTHGIPGRHSEWKHVRGIGTVPACWEIRRLGDCGVWRSGSTPSKARPDYWSGDLAWLSPKDMKRRSIEDTIDHVSLAGAAAASAVAPAGAIFVVVRGMILAHSFPVAIAARPCAFNQDIRALECAEGIIPEFILSVLEHMKERLVNLASPSTHGTMRIVMAELFDIEIPMPTSAEQSAIATAVGTNLARLDAALQSLEGLRLLKRSVAEALLFGHVRVPVPREALA